MTLFEQHQLPCLLESRLSNRYQAIVIGAYNYDIRFLQR